MEPCPPTALAITFAGVVVYGGKSLEVVAGSVQVVDQFSASLFVQMEKMILLDLVESFLQTSSEAHQSIWEINPTVALSLSRAQVLLSHTHMFTIGLWAIDRFLGNQPLWVAGTRYLIV